MPILPVQVITIVADLVIFIFVGYYLLKLRAKEKELDAKSAKIDSDYHKIVDDALTKERTILQDASTEASQILTGTQFVSTNSKAAIDQALQKMVTDLEQEAGGTAKDFMTSYQTSLKQIAVQSLTDFQNVVKGLQDDLQKQIKDFHDNMMPTVEKELEAYKMARVKQAEQSVTHVVQKVSQEVLNKTLSLDDHQNLIIDSLEKAKREGMFD